MENSWNDKIFDDNQIEELQKVARIIAVQTVNWCMCLQID